MAIQMEIKETRSLKPQTGEHCYRRGTTIPTTEKGGK
jgi:hypothetical protein